VRGLAALAAASAVLLTGCGAANGPQPGLAARVADETVSTAQVRDVADDYCSALVARQAPAIANSDILGQVASALALRAAADQFMAEHDVEPDGSYAQAVAANEQQTPDLTTEQRDAVVVTGGAPIYVQAAQIAVGRALLGDTASAEEALATGQQEFGDWLVAHDVSLDPRYGVSIDSGALAPADTSISFAVSEIATAAAAGAEADQGGTTAADLPQTQRCG